MAPDQTNQSMRMHGHFSGSSGLGIKTPLRGVLPHVKTGPDGHIDDKRIPHYLHYELRRREGLEKHFEQRFTYHRVWHWLKKYAGGCFEFPAPCMNKGTRPRRKRLSATFLVCLKTFLSLAKSQ
jgi:hypothetical protein